MKLMQVTHYFSTHRGGVELVAGKIVETINKNHRVDFIWASSDTDPYPSNYAMENFLSMSAMNFTERWFGIPYPIWSPISLVKLFMKMRSVDIVMFHDILYFGNIITFIFSKVLRKPIVVVLHVGIVPYKNKFAYFIMKFGNFLLAKIILKNVRNVICISNITRDYFRKIVPGVKIEMIYNGIDSKIFNLNNRNYTNRKNILDFYEFNYEKIILFVGRFVEKKGLHLIFEIAKSMREYGFILVGNGPISPKSWGLLNILEINSVEQIYLSKIYKSADLLILPSVGEGLPLVIQESMACGTPVITGEDTAAADPNAKHLIFSEKVDKQNYNKTVEIWLTKIKRTFEIVKNDNSFSDKISKFAIDRWSWNKSASKYYEIFDNILHQG